MHNTSLLRSFQKSIYDGALAKACRDRHMALHADDDLQQCGAGMRCNSVAVAGSCCGMRTQTMTTDVPSASGSRAVRLNVNNGRVSRADSQTIQVQIKVQITAMRQGIEHSIVCSADGIDYLHNPATMGRKEMTRNGIYPNAHQEYLRKESKPNAAS